MGKCFVRFHDGGADIASGTPLLTLSVSDGAWALFAKINVDNDDGAVQTVDCLLKANGVQVDRNIVRINPSGVSRADNIEVTLMAGVNFPSSGGPATNNITIECVKSGGSSADVSFRAAKIMAISVDSVTSNPG